MLTKKQNLIETMKGGNPEHFVNQYEAFGIVSATPMWTEFPRPKMGEGPTVDGWGVTKVWPAGTPGAFPVHDAEHIVIKNIAHWRDYVKMPRTDYSAAEWEPTIELAEKVDKNEQFLMAFFAPGVFEQCHYLMEIQNCLMNFYLAPDEMHDLIKYITEYELKCAEQICKYMKPEGIFHHDDWGSQISTFISPDMFEEFFVPAYKEIYGYYKSHGAELVVHHSDSYGATIVPHMIDMGIDIWQGVMTSNDIPALIKQYGPQITFMGGVDSASVDRPDWTQEMVAAEVERACTECGKHYFIPSASQGLPISTYPGVFGHFLRAEKVTLRFSFAQRKRNGFWKTRFSRKKIRSFLRKKKKRTLKKRTPFTGEPPWRGHASFLPLRDIAEQPFRQLRDALAGFCGNGDHLNIGIAPRGILRGLFHIKIKILGDVCLVYNEQVAFFIHKRVFKRLVVPLRHGEYRHILRSARVKLRRADEIAHVFKHNKVKSLSPELF